MLAVLHHGRNSWLPRTSVAAAFLVVASMWPCPTWARAGEPRQRVQAQTPRTEAVLDAYLRDIQQFQSSGGPVVPDSFLARGEEWLDDAPGLLCSAALKGDPRTPPRVVRAAVLLHMAASIVRGLDRDRRERSFRGGDVIVRCTRDLLPRDFQRRFAMAAIYFWQAETPVAQVVTTLDDALTRFGADADLLLAQGTLWETITTLRDDERPRPSAGKAVGEIVITGLPGQNAWEGPQKIYRRSAAVFDRVLKLAPDLDEARVRLAHAQIMLGNNADAAAAVAPLAVNRNVGSDDAESPVPYLAALMHGRALLAAGSADAALTSMRRAQSLCQQCQTPRIGVSQALRATGNVGAADELMLGVLRDGRQPPSQMDPWWEYPAGQWWRLSGLVTDLFNEVRQ